MKRPLLHAFTLMELLVVMGIIAALVGLLLPAVMKAGGVAKTAQTAALIRSIGTACEAYQVVYGFYPPESLASNDSNDSGYALINTPAESLNFFLAKKFVYKADEPNFSEAHASKTHTVTKATVFSTKSAGPFLQVNDTQARDFDGDGIPGLIDPWGQPILYNTLGGPYGDAANSRRPFHNTETFDLFSVGANGTSRQAGTSSGLGSDSDNKNNAYYVFNKYVPSKGSYAAWLSLFLDHAEGGNDTQGQGCNEMQGATSSRPAYTDKDRDDVNNWNYK